MMDTRKRSRKQLLGPVVIPDTTVLDELNEDVQVHIISFLDVASLRAMSSVNHMYRSVILNDEAVQTIWKPHLQRHWHMNNSDDTRMSLVDVYALPLAAGTGVNIPLLLSMTPSTVPTHVDEALLDHPVRGGSLFRRDRITHQLVRAPMPTKLAVVHQDAATLIRYTGPVGSGDRCVRANHPLPRPLRRKGTWSKSRPESILERICQGARAVSRRGSDWRPFCAPHRRPDGSMDVTPRMIAYYEVDILEQSASNTTTTMDNTEDPFPPILRTHTTECVAVGIATESFHIHSRMPGWDALSFGYHGDDGGIFHSSGGMIERFGPTFGRGDTVGCGIDYVAQAIFFTLNGKFLGYGWKNIGLEFLHNDLYPVVGIDTNALIELNFGITKPFQFDLTAFHQQHAKLIESQYQHHHHHPRRGLGIKMPSNRSIGSKSTGSSKKSSKR
jgi:hypothetical protein